MQIAAVAADPDAKTNPSPRSVEADSVSSEARRASSCDRVGLADREYSKPYSRELLPCSHKCVRCQTHLVLADTVLGVGGCGAEEWDDRASDRIRLRSHMDSSRCESIRMLRIMSVGVAITIGVAVGLPISQLSGCHGE